MTAQTAIPERPEPAMIPILDHGHVCLIDHMGDDAAIVQAARVSYGTGTKSVSADRGLIRYLIRHHHTSPIEMCEFKFRLKVPIFVMRQLVRHRTAHLNEYSGRYSIMSDEFYIPALDHIKPQSGENKQGRAGEIDEPSKGAIVGLMQAAYTQAHTAYRVLLGDRNQATCVPNGDDDGLSEDFPGIARELARSVLPVGNYTECYWKIDLSNLFKFLKLRQDAHAQYEIRVMADAMFKLIEPIVPLACEAFCDYMQAASTLSRMETNLLRDMIDTPRLHAALAEPGGPAGLAAAYGMTKRELKEFLDQFGC